MMVGSAAITVINNNNQIANSGAPPELLSLYFTIEIAILLALLLYLAIDMARNWK